MFTRFWFVGALGNVDFRDIAEEDDEQFSPHGMRLYVYMRIYVYTHICSYK